MLARSSPAIEAQRHAVYESLSAKDRRRYAAIEVCKLDCGGRSSIANVRGCDRHTLVQGLQELTDPNAPRHTRVRQEGGGRKSSHERIPGLDAAFLQVLADHTAGAPMRANVTWTNCTHQEIADRLAEDHGIAVSVTLVKRLLGHHDGVRRTAQKQQRTGAWAHRDAQCTKIAQRKEAYPTRGSPIVSIDTKKSVDGPFVSAGHTLHPGDRGHARS